MASTPPSPTDPTADLATEPQIEPGYMMVNNKLPERPYVRSIISTSRLKLRPFRKSDLKPLHSLLTDPDVMENFPQLRLNPKIATTRRVLRIWMQVYSNFSWVVCHAGRDELIGQVAIHEVPARDRWPILEYRIRPECWGRGYAREAARAVLNEWWRMQRVPARFECSTATVDGNGEPNERVVAYIATGNERAEAVMTWLGGTMVDTMDAVDERTGEEGMVCSFGVWILEKPEPLEMNNAWSLKRMDVDFQESVLQRALHDG